MPKRTMQSRLESTVQYLEEKYANHYDDHEDCVISTKRGKVVGKGSHKWLNRLIKVDRDVLEEIDSTLDEVESVAGSDVTLKDAYSSACLEVSQHLFGDEEFLEDADTPRSKLDVSRSPRRQLFKDKAIPKSSKRLKISSPHQYETWLNDLKSSRRSFEHSTSLEVSQDLFEDSRKKQSERKLKTREKLNKTMEEVEIDSLFDSVLDGSYMDYIGD